ncbi:hypothetical protein EV182_001906, partial [Spiromyces aspiralis]
MESANNTAAKAAITDLVEAAPSPPYNPMLGNWLYPYFALSIASIALCFAVIVVVLTMLFVRRDVALKPSFRLSASIAATDIIISSCRIAKLYPDYMASLSNLHLRVVSWLGTYATLSFMFLTGCIVLQLQLTVIQSKAHVAALLSPFYEIFSFALPLLMTHANLYAFDIEWSSEINDFASKADPKRYLAYSWSVYYAWIVLIWAYSIVVCAAVTIKLLPFWRQMSRRYQLPVAMTSPDDMGFRPIGQAAPPSRHSAQRQRRSCCWWWEKRARRGDPYHHPYDHSLYSPFTHSQLEDLDRFSTGMSSGGNKDTALDGSGSDGSLCWDSNGRGSTHGDASVPQSRGCGSSRHTAVPSGPHLYAPAHSSDPTSGYSADANRHLRHLKVTILRIMLYPLVPIICQTLSIIVQIKQDGALFYTPRYMLGSIQGILNC